MRHEDLKQFEGKHILVAGEIGVDEYLFGESHRISPEAPVPVVEVESQELKLGLAANVAQNLSALGAKTTLLSVRGSDKAGSEIEGLLNRAKLKDTILIEDPSRPTLRKVRVLSGKQHVVRIDYEKTHGLDVNVAKKFRETLCSLLDEVDGVIVQDYGKGLWRSDVMGFVAEARKRNKPIFVDPSRLSAASLYSGATLLSPNLQESAYLAEKGALATSLRGDDDTELHRTANTILEKTGAEHVVITCGAHGMVCVSRDHDRLTRIPTFAREVFDVTGAGDTVIALLSLGYLCGYSIADCLKLANAAAGIVVAQVGTAFVTPAELGEALSAIDA